MKKIQEIKNDQEAEILLSKNLSGLDFLQFKPVSFEYKPKTKQVSLRISEGLLQAVKKKADDEGISYQRYIRKAVEQSLFSS